jgi:hypothetical protein
MNEQEATALAQEIEQTFSGTIVYLEHSVYDHPETKEHKDYWTLWVSREQCEKWFYCKNIFSVSSREQLEYIRKQATILVGKEV